MQASSVGNRDEGERQPLLADRNTGATLESFCEMERHFQTKDVATKWIVAQLESRDNSLRTAITSLQTEIASLEDDLLQQLADLINGRSFGIIGPLSSLSADEKSAMHKIALGLEQEKRIDLDQNPNDMQPIMQGIMHAWLTTEGALRNKIPYQLSDDEGIKDPNHKRYWQENQDVIQPFLETLKLLQQNTDLVTQLEHCCSEETQQERIDACLNRVSEDPVYGYCKAEIKKDLADQKKNTVAPIVASVQRTQALYRNSTRCTRMEKILIPLLRWLRAWSSNKDVWAASLFGKPACRKYDLGQQRRQRADSLPLMDASQQRASAFAAG